MRSYHFSKATSREEITRREDHRQEVMTEPSDAAIRFDLVVLLIAAAAVVLLARPSSALVHLRGRSFSFSFLDAPARFAVPVKPPGICGSLHVGNPIVACRPLHNDRNATDNRRREVGPRFVLIARGVCSFVDKVRNAQEANFEAAIIYDDQDRSGLYSSVRLVQIERNNVNYTWLDLSNRRVAGGRSSMLFSQQKNKKYCDWRPRGYTCTCSICFKDGW